MIHIRGMIRRSAKKPLIVIHTRLEPDDHARLLRLANRQHSSKARIIKLAVREYLDRHSSDLQSPEHHR